jgi:ABC-type multidrug transport system permease subunit
MSTPLRLHPVWQLTSVKVKEFLREPEAVFWVFVFPVLLTLALGIAFRSRGPEVLAVAVVSGSEAEPVRAALAAERGLRVEILEEGAARERLRSGAVALVAIPGDPVTYWYDPMREESRLAHLLVNDAVQKGSGRTDPRAVAVREMTEKGSRYIDFLVPGLLGMNLMGTGMWGIGFSIVNARTRRILKRLVATPMKKSHYLLGQMFGRLVFLFVEVTALLVFSRLVFDVPIRGSLFSLAAITLLGAMTFAGFGLLIASRARTIEGVSGLMNVVMMPMWILSGIFFSTSRFPAAMQPVIQALPLTAVNNALRAVMIDGASIVMVLPEIAIAGAWGLAAFGIALYLFRWN